MTQTERYFREFGLSLNGEPAAVPPCMCRKCGGYDRPGDLRGDEKTARLDLVPDWVREFCAEQAKEHIKREYGAYFVPALIGGGVLIYFAIRGMTK